MKKTKKKIKPIPIASRLTEVYLFSVDGSTNAKIQVYPEGNRENFKRDPNAEAAQIHSWLRANITKETLNRLLELLEISEMENVVGGSRGTSFCWAFSNMKSVDIIPLEGNQILPTFVPLQPEGKT